MGQLTFYGHSDDLIEIEGDIEDEIPCWDQNVEILVNDGTILLAHYGTGGIWNFTIVKNGEGSLINHVKANTNHYSDVVTISNPLVKKLSAKWNYFK